MARSMPPSRAAATARAVSRNATVTGESPATSRPQDRRKARAAKAPSTPAARTRFRSLISRSSGIREASTDIGKARRRCFQGLLGMPGPMVQPRAEPVLLLAPGMFRLGTVSHQRRLEEHPQFFQYATVPALLRQIQAAGDFDHQRGRQDRVLAQEVDLHLHAVTKEAG